MPTFRVLIMALCSAAWLSGAWTGSMFVPGPHNTFTVRAGQMTARLSPVEVRVQTVDGKPPVRMKFAGARSSLPTGADQLETRMNFLLGPDPTKWRTKVPTYGRVRYKSLWRGIDAEFYCSLEGFEYDLIVGPGASPDDIHLEFDGPVRIDDGDLVLANGLRQHHPHVMQDGHEIESNYRLIANGRIGITVGHYDATKQLRIDPVITYATYLGGSKYDGANSIAVDSSGNAYIAGFAQSGDFPVTSDAYLKTSSGGFVSKIDPTGTKLLYSTYFDGTPRFIAVDAAGEIYVAGVTYDRGFFISPGAPLSVSPGGSQTFVAKFSADGSRILYSTYVYGSVSALAVDAGGSAYITGIATPGFVATPGAYQKTVLGSDAFVTKLNPAGTSFVYSTLLGGTQDDQGRGVSVDAAGSVYVTGSTNSPDFPVTGNAPQNVCGCTSNNTNAFVSKLSADGSRLLYSTFLGGKGSDSATAIAVDPTGSAYVTGSTHSADFPVTAGSYQSVYGGNGSTRTYGFVTKLNPTGSSLTYSTYFPEVMAALAVDETGSAYVTGWTSRSDFPTTPDALPIALNPYSGIPYVSRLSPDGQNLIYSTFLGGGGRDQATAIALGPLDDVFLAGSAGALNFPVTPGAIQQTIGYDPKLGPGANAFVVRLAFGDVSVSPANLKIENVTPHAPPANLSLAGTSYRGSQNVSAMATSPSNWLTVASDSTVSGPIAVTADPGGLNPGTYTGSIVFSSQSARVVPALLPVTFIVADFEAHPKTVTMGTDAVNSSQVLQITGGSGIYFTAASDSPWLLTDLPAGVTPARLNLSINPSGLVSGSYTGTVLLTPGNSPGDAVSVTVMLNVP